MSRLSVMDIFNGHEVFAGKTMYNLPTSLPVCNPLLMSCWLHTLLLLFSRDAKKCQGVLAALKMLQSGVCIHWTGCKLYPLRPTLGQILLPTGLSESKSVVLWLAGSANAGSHGFHQHPRAWSIHLCTFLYLWGSHWARWVMWGVLSETWCELVRVC